MKFKQIKNYPLYLSIILHIIIFLIFLIIKFSVNISSPNYTQVTFGPSGKSGTPGIIGSKKNKIEKKTKKKTKPKYVKTKRKNKKVNLPRSKKSFKIKTKQNTKKNNNSGNIISSKQKTKKAKRKGNTGKKNIGKNNLGYDIEWGGRGQRKIYSFNLPEYPAGVNKEIDIRLRFTILSDGTVGNIFPLIKADTRLEDAAINSLRQWRFEPLPTEQNKVIQTAVITFPYRLK